MKTKWQCLSLIQNIYPIVADLIFSSSAIHDLIKQMNKNLVKVTLGEWYIKSNIGTDTDSPDNDKKPCL